VHRQSLSLVGVSLVLASNVAGCAPAPAATAQGTVVRAEIKSAALADNLIGNPDTREYYVYLPPGYYTSGKRYPVVYALHWYGGHAVQWIEYGLPGIMDNLVGQGQAREMIFVFPDGDSKSVESWFMSSATIGDYEAYITKDLVGKIDSTYRTLPGRNSRGIMGCSMGGTAAFHLGLRYPDVFGVVVSMSSPTLDLEHDPRWQMAASQYQFNPQTVGDLLRYDFHDAARLSMAAVAAPNPGKPPLYFDLPFRLVHGRAEIVPEVFDKINNTLDPLQSDIRAYLGQPVRWRGFMIYDDTNDSHPVPGVSAHSVRASRLADQVLTQAGIEHEFRQIKGTHCDLSITPVIEFFDTRLMH